MIVERKDNALCFSHRGEIVRIEPWGKDSLRSRVTVNEKGVLRFYRDEEILIREYHRNYDFTASNRSICMKPEG
ncbi:MAG: hypothetical protein ACI32N_08455 [Bulleidia sp.]